MEVLIKHDDTCDLKYPYREAIGWLMYLTLYTRPGIAKVWTVSPNIVIITTNHIGLPWSESSGIWIEQRITVWPTELVWKMVWNDMQTPDGRQFRYETIDYMLHHETRRQPH
jgi:hypothetical protein